jgi:TolA-binding protein
MADDSVRITNPGAVGKAAAKGVNEQVSQLGRKIDELDKTTKQTNKEINRLHDQLDDLEQRIASLERRITDVEQTKARAQREALENFVGHLKEQVEEKREEWKRRRNEVLDDYRDSIERLKDRFVGSISADSEPFGRVEDEFGRVEAARQKSVDAVGPLAEGPSTNYEGRANAVLDARQECQAAIDDFLTDREETAEKIDAMQTRIPGVSEPSTVQVPFWVVGIERDGQEEIRVLPVLDRGSGDAPSRAEPYAGYLHQHGTHQYGDLCTTVHEYVSRDDVRETLASRDEGFADPAPLRRRDEVMDRFVDALERYQLGTTSARAEERTETPPETAESRTGMATDD